VQPTDFQVAPDELADAAGPFPAEVEGPLSVPGPEAAAAAPGPEAAAAAPAEDPVALDPRDDVHLGKVRQLHEQTRQLLSELRTAQDAVIAARNENQLAQGELNKSTVLIAQLSMRWIEISGQLGVRGIPLQQQRLLRQELVNIEQQSANLEMAKKNLEMNLRVGLPRKLKAAEHAVLEVVRKCDATIPAWIELADPYGAQSRGAHQRVAEACSTWLVGESIFAPAYLMRGFASWHVADLDRATEDFDQAVQQSEGNATTANQQDLLAVALSARAVLHAQRNQEAQAKADYTKAAELCPKSVLVCIFRGRANTWLGKTRPALEDFRRATQLDDKHPDAFREFDWLLASSPGVRDGRRAVDLGRIACDLTDWNQWQCLDTYALANAADGNFESAIENGRKALDLAPFHVRPEIQQRLALYQVREVPQDVIHR
jgi:tetratricopeptide (TPR) repeat protein